MLSDFEVMIMPQIRQILQVSNINKTTFPLTLSEMTGNVAFFVMKKIDVDRNGFVELEDLSRLQNDDQVSYELIEDLFTLAPDFMDKHRQVILGSAKQVATPASPPRNNNLNSTPGMSAEQRRLNPMAAGGGSPSTLTAEQKRLNPMAADEPSNKPLTAE